jgi:hypothetical protein
MKGGTTVRQKRLRQAAAVTGVGAIMAGASLLGSAQAHALTLLGTAPGAVSLTRASGSMSTKPTFATTEACPAGFQGSGTLFLNDPGGGGLDQLASTDDSVTGAFSGAFSNPLSLARAVFPDIAGTTSELVVKCTSGASGLGGSEYVMDTFLTVSAGGGTYSTSGSQPSGPTAATTTTLTASPSPAVVGQNITLTATVAPTAAGSGTPAGAVRFEVGGTAIETAVSLVNGVATTTTMFSAAGEESLSAAYTPSGSTSTGSTGTLSLTVQAAQAGNGAIPIAVAIPATGSFTLTVQTAGTVNLAVSGAHATGPTPPIEVSDTRNTYPGWSLSGQDAAWTGTGTGTAAGSTFSGNQLGWTPTRTALAQGVTLGPTVTPASPGIGTAGAVLASVHAGLGNGFGQSTLGASLNLLIPATAPAGPYTSGLTISAVTSSS